MLTTLEISKVKPSEATLNYEYLRSEGLKYIEQLSKKIWTDYNIHDPGVTILELLCYAITDLGYRTTYPIQDILTDRNNSAQTLHEQFFSAIEILPSKPVTIKDYRKLLIDVEGVKNAWLEEVEIPYPPVEYSESKLILSNEPPSKPTLKGLYNIILELDELDQESDKSEELEKDSEKTESGIFAEVGDRLHQNRNLCEDFEEIKKVEEQEFIIQAGLDVTPEADIDDLQARIFYEIQKFLTSPVKFYTLQEMFDKGKTTDEIFEGPVLEHGFIDDDELEKAHFIKEIRLSDIIQLIMDMEGVEVVRDIVVRPSNEDTVPENKWIIKVSGDSQSEYYQPVVNIDDFEITYYKDLVPVPPRADKNSLEKRLQELQEEEAEEPEKGLFKFTGQALSKLAKKGVPKKILDSLESLKNQGYTTKEEFLKKIKRFKITEQSLENLRNEGIPYDIEEGLKKLLEIESVLEEEAFWNTVKNQIEDDQTDQYKELILKHTEQTRPYQSLFLKYALEDILIPEGEYRNIQQYYSFQNHFPRNYGIGEAGLPESATTARKAQAKQLKAYLLFYDQLLANYFAQLAHIKDLFSLDEHIGHSYFSQAVSSVKSFEELYLECSKLPKASCQELLESKIQDLVEAEQSELFLQRRNTFLDHLLARFAEKFNEYVWFQYSRDQPRGEDEILSKKHAIHAKLDFLKEYEKISSERGKAINYRDNANLWEVSGLEYRVARLLGIKNSRRRSFSKLEEQSNQENGNLDKDFFVVEHILLRPQEAADKLLPARIQPDCPNCQNTEPYSFQISIILPAWRFLNLDFRRFAEKTFRLETPAHILSKICWIEQEQMNEFEKKYAPWLVTKAAGNTDSEVLNNLIDILRNLSNAYPKATLAARIDEKVSVHFKLTEQSLINLGKENIPDEIVQSLKILENQVFINEKDFFNAIKKCIDDEHTVKYEDLILKHAEVSNNPVILLNQTHLGTLARSWKIYQIAHLANFHSL